MPAKFYAGCQPVSFGYRAYGSKKPKNHDTILHFKKDRKHGNVYRLDYYYFIWLIRFIHIIMKYNYTYFLGFDNKWNTRIEFDSAIGHTTLTVSGRLTPHQIENRILNHFPDTDPEQIELLGLYANQDGHFKTIS